jgi:bacterioferritin
MGELNKDKAVDLLNRILEQELAGVVRYTHYSLLVFGFNRIPIVAWLREQATESLTHAQQAGEMITHLGAYPSLTIGPLLDTHRTDIGTILRESLASEGQALALYAALSALPPHIGCRLPGPAAGIAARDTKSNGAESETRECP